MGNTPSVHYAEAEHRAVLAALEHRQHLLDSSERTDWGQHVSRRLYELT